MPCLRLPNWAVAYHWLCHGAGAPRVIAYDAIRELSPSARPPGPNPAALAMGSAVTAAGCAGAGAVAVGVGAALAGVAGLDVSGACAAWLEGCVTAAAFLPVGADWLESARPLATPAAASRSTTGTATRATRRRSRLLVRRRARAGGGTGVQLPGRSPCCTGGPAGSGGMTGRSATVGAGSSVTTGRSKTVTAGSALTAGRSADVTSGSAGLDGLDGLAVCTAGGRGSAAVASAAVASAAVASDVPAEPAAANGTSAAVTAGPDGGTGCATLATCANVSPEVSVRALSYSRISGRASMPTALASARTYPRTKTSPPQAS